MRSKTRREGLARFGPVLLVTMMFVGVTACGDDSSDEPVEDTVENEVQNEADEGELEVPTKERFAALVERLGLDEPGLSGRLTEIHMGVIRDNTVVPAHHDEVLADALFQQSPFTSLLELPNAKALGFDPAILVSLTDDCRLQSRISLESRTGAYQIRTGKFKDDELVSTMQSLTQDLFLHLFKFFSDGSCHGFKTALFVLSGRPLSKNAVPLKPGDDVKMHMIHELA